ncbi:dihydroxyacetone kinase phosphoryl donor subunit DhaM [Cellulomonas sp. URHE0023]|uniref:dihydroxyacetone kinase phosphoryl donor subunit DhaM n=1 Tax=Cellulomonas sp. URHE0023 TaxID=1380354 RepID=UPI00048A12DC|nr:dihydroxyacetone kinase phosphoryl donor subunit DhaM [Cellulomonas sp. URHE0023]
MSQGSEVRVALILVSHSRALAEGAAELAGQMAPGVRLLAAGGGDDGGLGTSFDAIESAVATATADGGSAVVLTDLGSAVLTAESVLELADADVASRVRLADAPFVEGAVAAAVTAHGGADLATVHASAEAAGDMFGAGPEPAAAAEVAQDGVVRATVTVRNPLGLHARPAAVLARMLAGYDAKVLVDGANGASVLALMKLGATEGHELRVEAEGPQAASAVEAFVEAVAGGFGEV